MPWSNVTASDVTYTALSASVESWTTASASSVPLNATFLRLDPQLLAATSSNTVVMFAYRLVFPAEFQIAVTTPVAITSGVSLP